MVGNNPPRGVRGANQQGLVSIWRHWNDRYLPDPERVDTPAYEVGGAAELLELIQRLETGVLENQSR